MNPERPLRCGELLVAAVIGLVPVPQATAGPPPDAAPQAVKDAWLDARLETIYALNPQLAGYQLEVDVARGVARVSGIVASDIERDLVLEIAEGVEGLSALEHALEVDTVAHQTQARTVMAKRLADAERRSLGQSVADATTTARVKSNLVTNGNTKSLSIDVDTQNDVVTLLGEVPSRKEKMLAEMIARNTDGIANVRNRLEIVEPT